MESHRRIRPGDGPDRVYRALRQSVIEREFAPGARLPEGALAQRFGVSRTVVRAALERLGSDGLVERTNNRSARVAALGVEEAADLLDVRQGLEDMVIARIAGRLAAPDLARLHAHVAREEQASSLNAAEAVRLAGEFHLLLAELTGSPLLYRYVSEVVSRSSLILTTHQRPHSSSCAVREHHELIELIGNGDVTAAQTNMRAHLAHVAARAALA